MEHMKSVAVITARGGSKRISRKNIKDFCGKPIIAYSIEVAINSNIFDEVMVSTDDEEIKEIALKYGADVPFMRSPGTADDMATTADVLLEVFEEYKKRGKEYEYICCIYPTAPFITDKILIDAMNTLTKNQYDSVLPVVKFSFPPQRCFTMNERLVRYKYPENAFTRSQDLEPLYHDCGQFYCVRVCRFLKVKSLITENTAAIVMDENAVQDIDNISDWEIAEMKYRLLHHI